MHDDNIEIGILLQYLKRNNYQDTLKAFQKDLVAQNKRFQLNQFKQDLSKLTYLQNDQQKTIFSSLIHNYLIYNKQQVEDSKYKLIETNFELFKQISVELTQITQQLRVEYEQLQEQSRNDIQSLQNENYDLQQQLFEIQRKYSKSKQTNHQSRVQLREQQEQITLYQKLLSDYNQNSNQQADKSFAQFIQQNLAANTNSEYNEMKQINSTINLVNSEDKEIQVEVLSQNAIIQLQKELQDAQKQILMQTNQIEIQSSQMQELLAINQQQSQQVQNEQTKSQNAQNEFIELNNRYNDLVLNNEQLYTFYQQIQLLFHQYIDQNDESRLVLLKQMDILNLGQIQQLDLIEQHQSHLRQNIVNMKNLYQYKEHTVSLIAILNRRGYLTDVESNKLIIQTSCNQTKDSFCIVLNDIQQQLINVLNYQSQQIDKSNQTDMSFQIEQFLNCSIIQEQLLSLKKLNADLKQQLFDVNQCSYKYTEQIQQNKGVIEQQYALIQQLQQENQNLINRNNELELNNDLFAKQCVQEQQQRIQSGVEQLHLKFQALFGEKVKIADLNGLFAFITQIFNNYQKCIKNDQQHQLIEQQYKTLQKDNPGYLEQDTNIIEMISKLIERLKLMAFA